MPALALLPTELRVVTEQGKKYDALLQTWFIQILPVFELELVREERGLRRANDGRSTSSGVSQETELGMLHMVRR